MIFSELSGIPEGRLPLFAGLSAGLPAGRPAPGSSAPPAVARTASAPAPAPVPATAPAFNMLDTLEPGMRARLWRGDGLDVTPTISIPSGFAPLDRQLPGGGWPTHCLIELLAEHSGIGEIRLLAHTLRTLTDQGREIILLAPPFVPYPEGWARWGIDVSRIVLIRTERPGERLWAIEKSLRSAAFGALLAWVPQARPEALRRLQVAAANAQGLSFLFRPAIARHAPSPAPLRLLLEGQSGRELDVHILKRRGPVLAAPLHLHLPEIRPLLVPTVPTVPATPTVPPRLMVNNPASDVSLSSPLSSQGSTHAVDRGLLSVIAARAHPAATT